MSESLKELIARVKAQSTQHASSMNPPKPKPQQDVKDDEDYVGEDEETEEMRKQLIAPEFTPQNQEVQQPQRIQQPQQDASEEVSDEQRIAMEIELLQNDGRYRVELLHQLQEISKALTVIAGVLADLTGNGK